MSFSNLKDLRVILINITTGAPQTYMGQRQSKVVRVSHFQFQTFLKWKKRMSFFL